MNQRKIEIGIFSPYHEFTQLAMEAAEAIGVSVHIQEAPIGEVIKVARRWEREGLIEIVLARGMAATMLMRQNLEMPVVVVNITNIDMVEAIYNACQISSGFISVVDFAYRQPKFDFEMIKRVLGKDFAVLLYRNDMEIKQKLHEALQLGVETVVGTAVPIVEMASEMGFKTVLVHCNKESLKEALKQACNMVQVRRNDHKEKLKLATVLNNVRDGILVFDENGTINLCNPAAGKILHVKAAAIIGRHITEFSPEDTIRRVYGEGIESTSELVNTNGDLLVVNRNRMHVGGLETGTVITFQAADRIRKLEIGIRKELNSKGLVAKFNFQDIVGKSAAIRRAVDEARKYARSEGAVLITGESGTGKELFAHSIHNESRRREGPFVAVNCATLPEALLESELFGYEEGAFTGAKKGGKPGLFELAHGGTIFLDEVGEISIHLQARLLRVLQEREIMHVGGDRLIPIDVRVIAATNRNLREAVDEGKFRQDLFYRINVLNLKVPPLRDRLEDVPELFTLFINKSSEALRTVAPELSPKILKELTAYDWPGNVRELQNFVERYLALGEVDPGSAETLLSLLAGLCENSRQKATGSQCEITVRLASFDDMERQILLKAGSLFPEGKSELARILGVSRTTLWKKLKKAKGAVSRTYN
ncbi:MAG: sigma 54-interacting transcriptional regulator [Peptococcaceae bacterium]|nr:sigma 54-interacting transcriptional regulator [Peptococcaceae bacterium]